MSSLSMTDLGLDEVAEVSPSKSKPKPRFYVLNMIIEILLILALICGVFLAWKFWIGPWILGQEQSSDAVSVVQTLQQTEPATPPELEGDVPVRALPFESNAQYGAMYIPRLGADWVRPLATGVSEDSLAGNIGHYNSTAGPGQIGNYALAGHRTGWGDPFVNLPTLMTGDKIYIETVDGWYTYEFRNGSYQAQTWRNPESAAVLSSVPMSSQTPNTGDRIITLQTCNPPHAGGPELYFGYGVLQDFTPRSEGAPADVTIALEANNA